MTWMTQGPIAGRTAERITKSDVGVIACRRMFKGAITSVRNGEDPVAVVWELYSPQPTNNARCPRSLKSLALSTH